MFFARPQHAPRGIFEEFAEFFLWSISSLRYATIDRNRPMTHLDLFTLIVDRVFYRCTNTVFVNIVFAFGLIWTIISMRRDTREKVYSPRSSTSSAQEVFCTLFYAWLSPVNTKRRRLGAHVAAILRYYEITSGSDHSEIFIWARALHNQILCGGRPATRQLKSIRATHLSQFYNNTNCVAARTALPSEPHATTPQLYSSGWATRPRTSQCQV